MGSLHALSSTHWDQEPERGRSPAAARRQLGGLRKTRTPWSWRERCARGPGALRVQRFMESHREHREERGWGEPGQPFLPQHCLYFLPLPQGHGSLRPTLGPTRTGLALARASAASLTTSLGLPSAGAGPELPVAVAPP